MSLFSATTLVTLLGVSTAFAQYPTTSAASDACATSCVTAYRACQSAANANQAVCASQLASCVGYIPFDNSGSFVTPTACSSTASATSSTPAAPTYGSGADTCATSCVTAYRACQGAADANQAVCASQLASCVGYIPFDNSGSFVTPTACSSIQASRTANATSSMPAVYTGGAVLINAGGSFAAVAAGAVALMI